MKTPEQRINNVIGQLEGVKRLLSAKKPDNLEVLTQLKASRSALASLMTHIMTTEMSACIKQDKNKQEKFNKLFKEIIK